MLIGSKSEPTLAADPWRLYLYAMRSPETKEKYLMRLGKFLGFLGFQGTLEDKARFFADKGKCDSAWAFNSILEFLQAQKERFNRKEITAGTIRNYVKSIKLFCQMADVSIPWEKITRGPDTLACREGAGNCVRKARLHPLLLILLRRLHF